MAPARGKVIFPCEAPWLGALLEELSSFPLGRTKDQVDALVHALSFVVRPSEFAPVRMEGVATYDALAEYAGHFGIDEDEMRLDAGRGVFLPRGSRNDW